MVEIPKGIWTCPLEIEQKYQKNKKMIHEGNRDMTLHGMQLLVIGIIIILAEIEASRLSYMNHCGPLQIPFPFGTSGDFSLMNHFSLHAITHSGIINYF